MASMTLRKRNDDKPREAATWMMASVSLDFPPRKPTVIGLHASSVSIIARNILLLPRI